MGVVRDKKAKVSDMIEHFESKGIEVNRESLRSRSKTKRRIGDLEEAQERKAKGMLDDGDGDEPIEDERLAAAEGEARGRDRKRKREKSINPDDYMDIDEAGESSKAGKRRNLTPAQRTMTAQK